MDIFLADNSDAKCTVCGENKAPQGKSTMGTLVPIYNMNNQEDFIVKALFVHIECLNLSAVKMFDSIMLAQKIEEDKSVSS